MNDEKTTCKRCQQLKGRLREISMKVALLAAEQLQANKIVMNRGTLDTFNAIVDLANIEKIDEDKV